MSGFLSGLTAVFDFAPVAIQSAMAVVAAASTVTAITPTPRDDTALGQAYAVLELLALNIGRAKEQPPNR